MTDEKSNDGGKTKDEKKEPSVGDRAKEVLKDEAIRKAKWEGRSLFYKIFGHNIGRIIRRLLG